MDTMGEGNGGTNWKNSMETYKLPSVKYIARGNLLHDAESSNLVLCDNLEGWDAVGSGKEVWEGVSRGRGLYTYG